MTDRRAELEKKKLKLQQLRELKEQRRNDKLIRDRDLISDFGLSSLSTSTTAALPNSLRTTNLNNNANNMTGSLNSNPSDIKDVDDLLESVGIITNKSGMFQF